jgi:hypothetical protein
MSNLTNISTATINGQMAYYFEYDCNTRKYRITRREDGRLEQRYWNGTSYGNPMYCKAAQPGLEKLLNEIRQL